MLTGTPVVKDIVLIGGGHSHVAVLRAFGMRPVPGVRLTLISRDVHTPYSGMLPGLIAGHYRFREAHIDLVPLTRFAGARFYRDEVVGLDPDGASISLGGRPPVRYDLLSINTGSTPSGAGLDSDSEAIPVKPISSFLSRWNALKTRITSTPAALSIGAVGGGAGSVELILAVHHAVLRADPGAAARLRYTLLTDAQDILPTYHPGVRARFRRILAERGIAVLTNTRVSGDGARGFVDQAGTALELDEVLWVTQAGAPAWPAAAGLAVDAGGFVEVNAHLQSTSHPNVFAAGDVAALRDHPLPKSGVYAVRQGRPLSENLRRSLFGRPLARYRPQSRFLSLISTGGRHAVAARGNWSAEGRWVWYWKDWIDRRFMRRYQVLPDMRRSAGAGLPKALIDPHMAAELSEDMHCGGCGAKIGADLLHGVLDGLDPVARDDVVLGLDEPDDAALLAVPADKLAVHTVDAFRPMIDDPFVFGQIAANHGLGDIYAMGAEPQSALATVTLPYWPEDKRREELQQMLAGALRVFRRENTALIGGHTGEGPEPSLGFALTGLVDRDRVLRKSGAQPGDRLILTKPLGTGILFAADMRARARGEWIAAALESMLRSHAAACRQLLAHRTNACTDVTGFGLLGHLLEMLQAARLGAELHIDALPLLDGVLELAADGIRSSLHPHNQRRERAIANLADVRELPAFPLLFDPQTAGGLLAAVPPDTADACVAALRADGCERCAVIGLVQPLEAAEPGVRVS